MNEHPEVAQRLQFQMQKDGVSPGSRELRYEFYLFANVFNTDVNRHALGSKIEFIEKDSA